MDSLIFELQVVFYFQLFLSANVRHRKRGEHKNFIPFCVLLSFLDCIHTDSEVQTGATLFKITLKTELLSCFAGKPKTSAGKKIIAVEINK